MEPRHTMRPERNYLLPQDTISTFFPSIYKKAQRISFFQYAIRQMRCGCINTFSSICAQLTSDAALNTTQSQFASFCSCRWCRWWWRCYGPRRHLVVYVLRSGASFAHPKNGRWKEGFVLLCVQTNDQTAQYVQKAFGSSRWNKKVGTHQ